MKTVVRMETSGPASLSISRLVLGTMTFGSQVDHSEATRMVQVSLEAGINTFDTSNNYNDGMSEKYLGKAVEAIRDEILIATKVRNRVGNGPLGEGLSPPAIRQAIDDSLRRLNTSYVDLYYLHRPDPAVPIEETLGAVSELVEVGKVRAIGVSNYAAWQVAEMLCITGRNDWASVEVSQVLYNLIARRIEDEYQSFAESTSMLTIVFNPLAGGLLTGKYRNPDDRSWSSGNVFEQRQPYRERYWGEQQFHAVDRLTQIADQAGIGLVELAYRWLLGRPMVGAVLVGASRLEQLKDNLKAASEEPLDNDVLAACDDVWATTVGGAAPRYNR